MDDQRRTAQRQPRQDGIAQCLKVGPIFAADLVRRKSVLVATDAGPEIPNFAFEPIFWDPANGPNSNIQSLPR